MQTHLALIAKNCFPSIFGSNLKFLHKMQIHVYLGNFARLSVISMTFFTPRVYLESSATFGPPNLFPAIFGGNLEFLHKTQTGIYLRNGAKQSNFNKIFDPRVICHFWRKMFFLPFLEAILNFCLK